MEASELFEMPRVEMKEPSMSIIVAKEQGNIRNIGSEYQFQQRKLPVDALMKVIIDKVDGRDGELDESIAQAAYREAGRLNQEVIKIVNNKRIGNSDKQDATTTFNEILKTAEFDQKKPDEFSLNNNLEGDIKEKLTFRYKENRNFLDQVSVNLTRTETIMGKETIGTIGITIPLIRDTSDTNPDYKNTSIESQGGSFSHLNFREAAQQIVDSANQAAYKFEVVARKVDQDLSRIAARYN